MNTLTTGDGRILTKVIPATHLLKSKMIQEVQKYLYVDEVGLLQIYRPKKKIKLCS